MFLNSSRPLPSRRVPPLTSVVGRGSGCSGTDASRPPSAAAIFPAGVLPHTAVHTRLVQNTLMNAMMRTSLDLLAYYCSGLPQEIWGRRKALQITSWAILVVRRIRTRWKQGPCRVNTARGLLLQRREEDKTGNKAGAEWAQASQQRPLQALRGCSWGAVHAVQRESRS